MQHRFVVLPIQILIANRGIRHSNGLAAPSALRLRPRFLLRRRLVVLLLLLLLLLALVVRLELLRHLPEPLVYQETECALGPGPVRPALARGEPGQDLKRLVHGPDRVDPELPLSHGSDHFLLEHEVLHIELRDDHALVAREPPVLAYAEEPFDLLVHTADRLDLALLADRAGDGDVLPDRRLSNPGEERDKFGGRGAVAFHLSVALLEGKGRGD